MTTEIRPITVPECDAARNDLVDFWDNDHTLRVVGAKAL